MSKQQPKPKPKPNQPARPGHRRSRPRTPTESAFVRRIGQAIRSRRIASQMTAAELAAALDITVTSQFRREAGHVSLPTEELLRYAEALRCSPAELLGEQAGK